MTLEEQRIQIRDEYPAWIILAKTRGANTYHAVIERSFSMDFDSERANIFWSGPATDNIIGANYTLDGKRDAEHNCKAMQGRNRLELEVFDARSSDCPVEIDWEEWSKDMMVGASRKFFARNAKFSMKD